MFARLRLTYTTATTSAQCTVLLGTILRVAANYVHWQSMKLKAIKQPRKRSDSVYFRHQLFSTWFDSLFERLEAATPASAPGDPQLFTEDNHPLMLH